MFGRFGELKEMLSDGIEKFRQNGATSSEKAMSPEDLGLSSRFQTFLKTSPRLFGVFVRVDDKYYLSEERLKTFENRLSKRPLNQWLKHTASVPKGLLKFYVFKLLKDKPMSGSEIMEEVEKQTGGQWKPSPGSVYPLLSWLRDNGYADELPRDVTGVKRLVLSEKGKKFFEEHGNFEDQLQKKIAPMGPLFFLRMGLCADGLDGLQKPVKRFFDSLFDLRLAVKENFSEEKVAEVEEFLNRVSGQIEEFNRKLRS